MVSPMTGIDWTAVQEAWDADPDAKVSVLRDDIRPIFVDIETWVDAVRGEAEAHDAGTIFPDGFYSREIELFHVRA